MISPPLSQLGATVLRRPFYMPLAFVLSGMVLALSMTPFFDVFVPRLLLFYAGTALAYALMPYVRRGDIPLVAAWVILVSELAPCVAGELISPVKVTADALGVLMATGPIYLARLRQVMQGDVRPAGRRASELRR
ncbi:hypothetical protein [Phenylobacterium sp. SCN 70-31]|uniref:hypothetical protein n=1 Tax=Phenylobacterium sp. SCN 70-31 TaxID=1660129 RepID=UPI00086BAC83|nr:hypothetical protein [Phenylobacterium sp. SCN 70-31]ODT86565.1 MAG: hypothetical protein ABS78_15775 [Phenylobacterium sp. SCN 70-31]